MLINSYLAFSNIYCIQTLKKSAYEPLIKTTLSHLIIIIKKLYNLKCLTLTYRAYF